MELTEDVENRTLGLLTAGTQEAPVEVIGALVSLVDPDTVTASMVRVDHADDDSSTTWRAVWLTDTHLACCEATAPVRYWSRITWHGRRAAARPTLDVWVVPTDAITALQVLATEVRGSGQRIAVDMVWNVEVGERSFTAPLSGSLGDEGEQSVASAEAFVMAVRRLVGLAS